MNRSVPSTTSKGPIGFSGTRSIRQHRHTRAGDHEKDECIAGRPSNGTAVRPAAYRADRQAPQSSVDRRRCLLERQRDPVGRALGKDRQAAWRCRLFLVPPTQGDQHRRRRNDHHAPRRLGRALPVVAPACNERSGRGATQRERGDLRVLPGDGLQLPDDGHPGRGRSRAAQAPARSGDGSAQGCRVLPWCARRHQGPRTWATTTG